MYAGYIYSLDSLYVIAYTSVSSNKLHPLSVVRSFSAAAHTEEGGADLDIKALRGICHHFGGYGL